ncbi:MAG: helix-turn-helix transcriptional regulator [Oscillospiraceae bacterium]|nr:helix-turn-helix transcriptional regulator [Oscillospiraceae bacterium]
MQIAISQLFLTLYEYTNKSALESNSEGIQAFRQIIEKANRVSTKDKPKAGISSASVTKMGKNGHVTTEVLVKICSALDCTMDDIMEIVPD